MSYMSRTNKQKHVMLAELGSNDFLPPAENQQFARVMRGVGNNLFQVQPEHDDQDQAEVAAAKAAVAAVNGAKPKEAAEEEDAPYTYLASMPLRFRHFMYCKYNTYVVIEAIPEGNKVRAEIVRVLQPVHVRQFKKDGIWPAKFDRDWRVRPDAAEYRAALARSGFVDKEAAVGEAEKETGGVEKKQAKSKSSSDDSGEESDSDDDGDLVRNTNGWHGRASDSESEEESSSEEEEDEEDEEEDEDEDGEDNNDDVEQVKELEKATGDIKLASAAPAPKV